MKISLNNHDIETAITEFLASRNITNSVSKLKINLSVLRGAGKGAQAEIEILDHEGMNATDSAETPKPAKSGIFSNDQ